LEKESLGMLVMKRIEGKQSKKKQGKSTSNGAWNGLQLVDPIPFYSLFFN
jgi:hypothetical protein